MLKPRVFGRGKNPPGGLQLVDVTESLHELAVRDLKAWPEPPSDADLEQWIGAMEELLADVVVGEQYVCLDGLYIPTSASAVRFQGWHAVHDLDFVPHVAALDDYSVLENILASQEYWQSNAIPDSDGM